jgi:predicted DNA-binding protein
MRKSTPSKRKPTAGRVGRPPAGDRGERVKDYPQVSFRLPTPARDKLVALSQVRKQPQWRLIVESVECYLRDLPRQEQAQIARLLSGRRPKDAN